MINELINRVKRKWMRLRFQPIRVFCFHHVSDEYNSLMAWQGDWTQTEVFKRKILAFKDTYTFITLNEAYDHLTKDKLRYKKYAVLTADDGMQCIADILPWLEEQKIPITLFISAKYLDGKSYYSGYDSYWKQQGAPIPALRPQDLYLMPEQIRTFQRGNVDIGIHGWEHVAVNQLSQQEFETQTNSAIAGLQSYNSYVPFYAFTYGKCNPQVVDYVRWNNLIPVLCDGLVNTNYDGYIHRECIDGE